MRRFKQAMLTMAITLGLAAMVLMWVFIPGCASDCSSDCFTIDGQTTCCCTDCNNNDCNTFCS